MSEITGGELFARALQAEGIEFLFGLPSPESDPLLVELEAHGIRLVPIRHEAAAVHMAEGLYKTTGRVAAVLGNPGPGSANLLPGVLTAKHEGVPVLVITSQHRLGIVYPSSPATFQGQDQLELFRPAVKWGGPVFEWSRIPEVLRMAFREMWSGRPGPVHIELPAPDPLRDGRRRRTRRSCHRPPTAPAGPHASEAQIEQAAQLLASAERPVVIAGTGVDRADANERAARGRRAARMPGPDEHGRALDRPLGPPELRLRLRRRGRPRPQRGRRAAGGRLARGKPRHALRPVLGRPRGQAHDPDRRRTAAPRGHPAAEPRHRRRRQGRAARHRRPAPRARDLRPRDGADLERYRALDVEVRMAQATPILEWKGPGIHPAHAVGAIGAVFGPDAVYTVDGGNTSLWAYSVLPPTRPRSYHSILELGMLGTGIPSAIGAKLGAPDREVVCVTGDGAAGFNIMEMQSAAREGLALTTIVFAEGSWTMEEPNELDLYGRTFGTAQGDDPLGRRRDRARLPQRVRRAHRGPRGGAAPGEGAQRPEPGLHPLRPRREPRRPAGDARPVLRGLLGPGRARARLSPRCEPGGADRRRYRAAPDDPHLPPRARGQADPGRVGPGGARRALRGDAR